MYESPEDPNTPPLGHVTAAERQMRETQQVSVVPPDITPMPPGVLESEEGGEQFQRQVTPPFDPRQTQTFVPLPEQPGAQFADNHSQSSDLRSSDNPNLADDRLSLAMQELYQATEKAARKTILVASDRNRVDLSRMWLESATPKSDRESYRQRMKALWGRLEELFGLQKFADASRSQLQKAARDGLDDADLVAEALFASRRADQKTTLFALSRQLSELGYVSVQHTSAVPELQPGDIVLYTYMIPDGLPQRLVTFVGCASTDQEVISYPSEAPNSKITHLPWAVPQSWGDELYIFRKQNLAFVPKRA